MKGKLNVRSHSDKKPKKKKKRLWKFPSEGGVHGEKEEGNIYK